MNASGRNSRIPDLIKAGIEVPLRHNDGDQHSKYLIIDQAIVVTGNYNFTLPEPTSGTPRMWL